MHNLFSTLLQKGNLHATPWRGRDPFAIGGSECTQFSFPPPAPGVHCFPFLSPLLLLVCPCLRKILNLTVLHVLCSGFMRSKRSLMCEEDPSVHDSEEKDKQNADWVFRPNALKPEVHRMIMHQATQISYQTSK